MPEHARFLAMQDEREQMLERKYELQTKLSDLEMLASSQKPPVQIPPSVARPATPIKPPRRPLYIAFGVAFSLALGIGLVCILEHVDRSVKVPEHLTLGLTLPILGLCPGSRRTSLVNRAWASLDARRPGIGRGRRASGISGPACSARPAITTGRSSPCSSPAQRPAR
ncbi:MAG: hypothetical protein U0794_17910 [Isosphaeraceae bacterium]